MKDQATSDNPLLPAAAFVAALTAIEAPVPKGLTTRRGAPDARRFAIYRNNVHVSLVEALGKKFPVVQRLVGDEFFRGMARDFVQAVKPRSPVLLAYGAEFPAFVARFRPAQSLPYLADVAQVEISVCEAYHAAEAPAIDRGGVAAIAAERIGDMVIEAHPATRLVRSAFPVGTIWSNHQAEAVKPVADWDGEDVLITRPLAEVRLTVLPPSDRAFVAALLSGRRLAEAAELAMGTDAAFHFGRALMALVDLGAVRAVNDKGKVDV